MSSAEASVAGDTTPRTVRLWLAPMFSGLFSGLALLGSAVSLWESTLKQAEIKLYVSDNIFLTLDPWGSYEVLIVPITIANRGARDGAVLSLALDVKNSGTSQSKRFKSSYMAEAPYFGGRDDVTTYQRRPKLPFAPLSVAGRFAFTGTILFYPEDTPEKKIVDPKSKIEMTLTVALLSQTSWLDRLASAPPPPPSTLTADVPNYLPGALFAGQVLALKVKADTP
jgi:hypothetical protein